MSKKIYLITAAALVVFPASAHVTREKRQAPGGGILQGGSWRAVWLRGIAFVKPRVQIPEGVIGMKPMPKPGWTVETVKGGIFRRVTSFTAATISEASRKCSGVAANSADDNFDEFVLATFLTGSLKPNTTLYFPVVQECEQGVSRWIEIPARRQVLPWA